MKHDDNGRSGPTQAGMLACLLCCSHKPSPARLVMHVHAPSRLVECRSCCLLHDASAFALGRIHFLGLALSAQSSTAPPTDHGLRLHVGGPARGWMGFPCRRTSASTSTWLYCRRRAAWCCCSQRHVSHHNAGHLVCSRPSLPTRLVLVQSTRTKYRRHIPVLSCLGELWWTTAAGQSRGLKCMRMHVQGAVRMQSSWRLALH